jgi:hypothetical protein
MDFNFVYSFLNISSMSVHLVSIFISGYGQWKDRPHNPTGSEPSHASIYQLLSDNIVYPLGLPHCLDFKSYFAFPNSRSSSCVWRHVPYTWQHMFHILLRCHLNFLQSKQYCLLQVFLFHCTSNQPHWAASCESIYYSPDTHRTIIIL